MAIVYIIMPDQVVEGSKIVDKINQAIYNLTRPATERDSSYITSGIFPWFQHPDDGRLALQIITDYVLVLHHAKNPNDLLRYYTIKGKELNDLRNLLTNSSQIEAGQLIASDFETRTHDEMVAEGWFEDYNF